MLREYSFSSKALLLDSNANIGFDVIKPRQVNNGSPINKVRIAYCGTFVKADIGEFELTEEVFNDVVLNFNRETNALPIYRGHADMNVSYTGEEPPAAGWILALSTDGENLFALVEFTDKLAEQYKLGEFRDFSINIRPSLDRKTGEEIGYRMFSLAVTNQPFLDGLGNHLTLSDKTKTERHIYQPKPMAKKNIKLADSVSKEETAQDQLDKMQQTKTMAPDGTMPDDLWQPLEELKTKYDELSSMNMKDFVDYVCQMIEAEQNEPEPEGGTEVTEATEDSSVNAADMPVADGKDKKDDAAMPGKKKITVDGIEYTALSEIVLSQDEKLIEAQRRIAELEAKLSTEKTETIASIVDKAISLAWILPSDKESFIKLGNVDRKLFDTMLKAREKKPVVSLNQITKPHPLDGERADFSKVGPRNVPADWEARVRAGAGLKS